MAKLITMQEAAKKLNVSYKTIQRYIISGKLKSQKDGNLRLIPLESLNKIIQKKAEIEGVSQEIKPDSKEKLIPSSELISVYTKGKDQEIEFLRDVIRNQQKQISEQNERITEIDQLILNTQSQLAQLNKTLQLYSGQNEKKEDETFVEEKLEKDTDLSTIFKDFTEKEKKPGISPLWLTVIILIVVFLGIIGYLAFSLRT